MTITDVGLALEAAVFAAVLARRPTRWPRLRRWSVVFFGTAAVASLAGAADHGLCRRLGRERAHDALWVSTLLAMGATALTVVGVGAEIGLPRPASRRLTAVAAVAAVAYALVVLAGWREFRLAILAYAPAALFLLVVLLRRYARRRDRGSLLGIAAVLLAFVAAAVQQREISVHPRYLGHNALYHLIQAVSFALFFAAARLLLRTDGVGGPASRPR
ncbi:MAG: hypothetical protein M3N47_01410 [Chloroflexota bacterium]|nr:hypothetical protein [Chloroflexota bacterium]